MQITQANPAPPHSLEPAGADLKAAARDLHRQFLAEMLKQAKLTEALAGADGGGPDLAGALASTAIDVIATDMAAAQPGLTQRLYEALKG